LLVILPALNLLMAGILLLRELFSHPNRFRAAFILLSILAAVLFGIQTLSGYYFVFDPGQINEFLGAVLTYVLVMVLTVSGKRMKWHLNRIIGVCGLLFPFLYPPMAIILFLFVSGFNGNARVAFQGQLSPHLAFKVTSDGSYYRLSLFRKLKWAPMLQKRIAEEPIYN
jgi:hypothetical protein